MKILVIDLGHGGEDSGAVNPVTHLKEKDVVLSLYPRLRKRFRKYGIYVAFTRTTDEFLSLKSRVEFANELDADLFFSIHCNAADAKASGIECFHYQHSQRSALAAELCQEELMRRFPKHRDRGVKSANFYVLRETNMEAVLWELEFIDSKVGNKTFKNRHKMDLYADAIESAAVNALGITRKKNPSQLKRLWGRVVEAFSNMERNH